MLLLAQTLFQTQLCLPAITWLQLFLGHSNTGGAAPQLPLSPEGSPGHTAPRSRDLSAVMGSGAKWGETQIRSPGVAQQHLARGAPAVDPWLPVFWLEAATSTQGGGAHGQSLQLQHTSLRSW